MIKKRFFALILCALGIMSLQAQDNLHLYLKDGSVLNGYVSRQIPGKEITVTTSSATIVIDNNKKPDSLYRGSLNWRKVNSIVDHDINIKNLAADWVKWAEDNDAFLGEGNNRHLILSDVILSDGSQKPNVRVLESGQKVKFLELTPNNYTIKMEDVEVIKADKRPKLQLSGINRKYKLSSGMEYEGQYVEEVPWNTLSICQENGVTQVLDTYEVVKDIRYKINPNQTLIEQSPLIEVVQQKNGTVNRGVIMELNYSTSDNMPNDYLLIQLENGMMQSVPLSEVQEYRKEKNDKYKPIIDIVLEDNEASINRNNVALLPTKEFQSVVTIPVDSLKLNIPQSNPQAITAEFKMDNSSAQQLKLLKIRTFSDKKTKKNYYGFSYEDMAKNTIMPKSVETSVNGISKLEYALPFGTAGIYGIYNPLTNKIVIFKISTPTAVG